MDSRQTGLQQGKAYPTFIQAVMLALLAIGLQIVFNSMVRVFVDYTGAHVDSRVIIGIGNIFSLGIVIYVGLLRSDFNAKLRILQFNSSVVLLASMVLTIAGLQILLSELDNLLRMLLPIPPSLGQLFEKLVTGQGVVFSLLVLVVVAPVTEETLFRGVILHGFLKNYTAVSSALLCALLFSVVHLNPWQFAGAFVLGVYLCFLYIKTRSLSLCMLAHAVNNGLPLFVTSVLCVKVPGYTTGFASRPVFQPLWFDLLGLGILLAGIALSVVHGKTVFAKN